MQGNAGFVQGALPLTPSHPRKKAADLNVVAVSISVLIILLDIPVGFIE